MNMYIISGKYISGKYTYLYFYAWAEWWWVAPFPHHFVKVPQIKTNPQPKLVGGVLRKKQGFCLFSNDINNFTGYIDFFDNILTIKEFLNLFVCFCSCDSFISS